MGDPDQFLIDDAPDGCPTCDGEVWVEYAPGDGQAALYCHAGCGWRRTYLLPKPRPTLLTVRIPAADVEHHWL